MFVFGLRNNLSKFFCTCCYLPTNTRLLLRHGAIGGNISKRILKKQQFPPSSVLRWHSSASITPYQSSRKYIITWKLERLLGWSLIVLIPTAFVLDSKELEMTLSVVALLHTYWGCQSVCSDYLRSHVVGKFLPVIVRLSVVFLFLTSIAGAYQLIYEDVGLINMIKKFWAIRGRDYVPPKQRVERK